MDCSTPGFPVHHNSWSLLKHVHLVGDVTQPSHPPSSLLLLPSIFPSIRVFQMSQFFASHGQSIGDSASASVLPVTIQDWFPLGLTGLISYASKFRKLSSGHRTRKGQFSFQSQRKTMPKNVQTTTQLHSFRTLAKQYSKFSKLGFNSM